jgi:hypothetical protein
MADSILNIDTTGTPSVVVADATAPLVIGTSGSGGIVHSINGSSVGVLKTVKASSGALSGASFTFTNLIPAGCFVYQVRCKVTTLVTGSTAFLVGVSGNTDKFAAALAVAAGSKSNSAIDGDATTVAPELFKTATGVLLTSVTSNFTAGAVDCEVVYFQPTAIE